MQRLALWLGPDGLGMEEGPGQKEGKGRREGKGVGMKGEMEGQGKKEGRREEENAMGSTGYASGSTKTGRKDPNLELQKPHSESGCEQVNTSAPESLTPGYNQRYGLRL